MYMYECVCMYIYIYIYMYIHTHNSYYNHNQQRALQEACTVIRLVPNTSVLGATQRDPTPRNQI